MSDRAAWMIVSEAGIVVAAHSFVAGDEVDRAKALLWLEPDDRRPGDRLVEAPAGTRVVLGRPSPLAPSGPLGTPEATK